MKQEISPGTAAAAIALVLLLIGGIWWFARGRGPAPVNPQDVERMLQQERGAPGEGGTPAPAPR